jgi:TonB family protein
VDRIWHYALIAFAGAFLFVMVGSRPTVTRAAVLPSLASPSTFPDSTDGLKAQLDEVLKAYQKDDSKRVAELLGGFFLPQPDVWMERQFGKDRALSFVGDYGRAETNFGTHFRSMLESDGKLPAVEVEAAPVDPPELPMGIFAEGELPVPLTPIHIETFRIRLAVHEQGPAPLMYCFVYEGGAFRLLGGGHPFWIETPLKMHVEHGVFQAAKLFHMESPEYPLGARAEGVEGVVILHAIIGTDGKVRDLSLISGNRVFVKSAISAVRRWRYRPTTLNGIPIEVDTSISVIFSLHPR